MRHLEEVLGRDVDQVTVHNDRIRVLNSRRGVREDGSAFPGRNAFPV